MKQIFVEETRHVALSRQMQLDWSAEKKEKLKRVVLLKIKQILNNGIGVYNPQKYLTAMEERGIKLKDLLPDMKKSRRAKDFTTSTVLNMFKSARDMKLIPEEDIDQFLINNNLQEKYNEFL
jgi:hypothetical protein